MKDDIKEILDKLKDDKQMCSYCYYRIFIDDRDKLLDYITNLQEENKELKLELSGYREAILRNDELLGLQNYKSRNEKAIEYINKNKHLSMFADCREPEEDWNYVLEINPRDLLNILQGDDKDE